MQSAGNELPKRARLQAILRQSPIVAVITIDGVEDAVPLARALVAGGVTALELTLRTPAGLAAAAAILKEVPEAVVGVGTILNPDDLAKAKQSGAHFGVSPGITAALLDAAAASDLPFMPGIQSASELMEALTSSCSRRQRLAGRRSKVLAGHSPRFASARPAASARRISWSGWRCPMWRRSAARGWHRGVTSVRATGRRSPTAPAAPWTRCPPASRPDDALRPALQSAR